MYRIERKDEEIDSLLNDCAAQIDKGGTKYRGMTYEQGIEAALRWVTDKDQEAPLE